MELIMQEYPLAYLRRVLCETMLSEQTADVIVPDSYPDADRVVDCFGNVLVRSAECSSGSVSVVGTVQAGVIFVTEEGEVHSLQTQIPFSFRKELPKAQEDCVLQCKCTLRAVDARLVNSRKLLVRASVSCTLCAYSKTQTQLWDIPEPSQQLQLKRTELPLKMPIALGEKSFSVNEELELPANQPAMSQLMKAVASAQITEQKAVGSKAVFKGNLRVHILYADSEEALRTYDWELPFSQYAELAQEAEDASVQTMLTLTGFEAEPDSQIECRRLFLSASLIAQCTAIGERKVAWIEDAFCTDAELAPEWETMELLGLLDEQSMRETVLANTQEQASSVVDVCVYPDEAVKLRTAEGLSMQLPLNCNVMYYDTEGQLQSKSLHPTLEMQLPLHEQGSCQLEVTDCTAPYCSAGAGGLELRIPVQVHAQCYAEHPIRAVCGGEIGELERSDVRKPAVILRRTEAQEEAWDIAKACHAPLQAILQANHLESASIPANTMLLIPM